jgi:predicted NBD/HSP70 family sugar kinase
MKLYVGLDVGLEETSLCIVDSEGQTVRELKVSTEPEAIRSALESSADRLESGSRGIITWHLALSRIATGRGSHHRC